MTDLAKLAEELAWLKANPAFEERPASLEEFLGPDYLNIREKIRKRIVVELREIMGSQVSGTRPTAFPEAMITGGIGIGKTTVASVVLPYLAHWVLCLKDPQDFYDLLPGSRIAFMQMSTSEKQALEVVFGDIKARIKHSPWFQKHPYDPSFKNQLRFEKDIWIIPGDSSDLTFEGYNILGGIIDEADSHKVTQTKDYAEDGYNAISNRITSRFQDKGFLLVIGQMKMSGGFASRKYEEFKAKPDAYAVRLAIWDSMGDEFEGYEKDKDGKTIKFAYDTKRKQIVPDGVVDLVGMIDQVLWIPILYKRQFVNNPEKALRDLAGMPPAVNDPFISLVSKIDAARDRWILRYPGFKSPITPDGRLEPWFKAHETIKRTLHIDLAYSGDGDALGMAMGHVPQMVDINGERKPYIVIDLLLRMKALPGGEIFLGDVRNWVYMLRDQLKFKIDVVTMDGFESTDTMQQLQRKRFHADYVSVDKQILPYHDLREALYEDRIDFPPYICDVHMESGTQPVEILVKELTELMDTGRKIDHPLNGSKDVADAVAGVTFTLMGDRRYHRNTGSLETSHASQGSQRPAMAGVSHPAFRGDFGASAPLPPNLTGSY
jgi:hypothetical protein